MFKRIDTLISQVNKKHTKDYQEKVFRGFSKVPIKFLIALSFSRDIKGLDYKLILLINHFSVGVTPIVKEWAESNKANLTTFDLARIVNTKPSSINRTLKRLKDKKIIFWNTKAHFMWINQDWITEELYKMNIDYVNHIHKMYSKQITRCIPPMSQSVEKDKRKD